uniref:Uncharacterized protein n=1 Tax=Kalanchoe fedtschenkoi TaxID=63787 RepID=A0A7N1A5A9_KALFE
MKRIFFGGCFHFSVWCCCILLYVDIYVWLGFFAAISNYMFNARGLKMMSC